MKNFRTLIAPSLLASCFLLLASSFAGCKATKSYPDPFPGWHNADYSAVFGRLQRIPNTDPAAAPIWIVRFDLGNESHGGQFALTPPEAVVGYSGGEQVEVKGAIRREGPLPGYTGTWYNVRDIKMWNNYR